MTTQLLEQQVDDVERSSFYLRRALRRLEGRYLADLTDGYRDLRGRLLQMLQAHIALYGWQADPWFISTIRRLLDQVDAEAEEMERALSARLSNDWDKAYRMGYFGVGWLVSRLVGARYPLALSRLDAAMLQAIREYPYEGAVYYQRLGDYRFEFIRKLRRELTLSTTQGEGSLQAARRLSKALQLPWNQAELLARTELQHAANLGAAALMTQNPAVVVRWQWSAIPDERTCPICRGLHGRIFNVGQRTPPPQHPRCLPGDTHVASCARVTAISKRWYEGDMIFFRTASGNELTITPNHPILTDRGWLAAQFLQPGQDVFRCLNVRQLSVNTPDDQYVPASIEEIASACIRNSKMVASRVKSTPEDFHGDGRDSEVDIIWADGKLRRYGYPHLAEQVGHLQLQGFDARLMPAPDSLMLPPIEGLRLASRSIMRRRDLVGTLACSHTAPLERLRLGLVADVDARSEEPTSHGATRDLEAFRDSVLRYSAEIERDRIVYREGRSFKGHVYNLQTDDGWYLANAIVSHNCRCLSMPLADGVSAAPAFWGGVVSYAAWAVIHGIMSDDDGGLRE